MDLNVAVDDAGWHASATFVTSPVGEDREGWAFPMQVSPYFTLRLLEDEQATILVQVEEEAWDGRLLLAAA